MITSRKIVMMVVTLDVIVVFAFCLMSLKNELNESASFVEDCVILWEDGRQYSSYFPFGWLQLIMKLYWRWRWKYVTIRWKDEDVVVKKGTFILFIIIILLFVLYSEWIWMIWILGESGSWQKVKRGIQYKWNLM